MTFSYAGVSAFLALYARELDLMAAASNFLLCYAILLMICRTFTGNICDKKKGRNMLFIHVCWLLPSVWWRWATPMAAS